MRDGTREVATEEPAVVCDHLWKLVPIMTSDGSPWGTECLGCHREFWTEGDYRELFG